MELLATCVRVIGVAGHVCTCDAWQSPLACWPCCACCGPVQYSVDDQLDSMLPLYRRINKDAPHLRTLIYTGTPAAELI